MPERPTSVLFVCLGNICRSPLAEGLFLRHARERAVLDRFTADSCGLGDWHAGELPDPRTRRTAAGHGLQLTHRARKIDPATDFERFGLILAMDASIHHGTIMLGAPRERTRLMREFEPDFRGGGHLEALDVPDPYSGTMLDFEHVHEVLDRCTRHLLEFLLDATSPHHRA
jgi:protein-tyrosine phosphatase